MYCEQFVGEAKNMLYRLKNRMNIAVPKLKTLQDIHLYDDGTTITVRSVFGQDFIEINAGRAGFPSCSITILDLPLAVPPMKWYAPGEETFTKGEGGWVITGPDGKTEVEGVDYIKTYYSASTKDCPGCTPLAFTVAEGADANILTGSSPNRPFWYKAENDDGSLIYNYEGAMVPHHMGYDWTHPPIPPNPLNHTIYSLWGCQAQIIKIGNAWSFSDAGGSYFLWKAYTEWSNVGPGVVTFSRTGLGYMLMQAFIRNGGINLCESEGTIIKVDCCLKPASERPVILWWESLGPYEKGGPTCTFQPFMFYGSIKICEVPSEVAGWYALLCTGPGPGEKGFYVIPEVKGGCLPFTWTIDNNLFVITPSVPNGEAAGLKLVDTSCNSGDCHTEVTVTVKDRCGTEDKVRFVSCCELAALEVYIGYTSLVMSCGASQTLTAGGGCGPYTWSAGGAGSLSVTQGPETTYTAPATNPNCTSNPTVTLTDCCGSSAQLKLAVNCYTPNDTAYRWCEWEVCNQCSFIGETCAFCAIFKGIRYNCMGVLISTASFGNTCADCSPFALSCANPREDGWSCPGAKYGGFNPPCGGQNVGCNNPDQNCNTWMDIRTQAMKDAGCCPINPLTGLLY